MSHTVPAYTPRPWSLSPFRALQALCLPLFALALCSEASAQCMHWDSSVGMSGYGPGTIYSFENFDDGTGPKLYAAIDTGVVRWNGTYWPIVIGFDDNVYTLYAYDDGSGPALYAGGVFQSIPGYSTSYWSIAKRVGTNWLPVGGGIPLQMPYGEVRSLTSFDDGSGPKLFAAGAFQTTPAVGSNSIVSWDGTAWTGVGGGLSHGSLVGQALCMCVFDGGTGPALYVGGSFTAAGGTPAVAIARWDGSAWSALGSGLPSGSGVTCMTVFDDGSGPALYVGGVFNHAGGIAVNNIAKWNGTAWSALSTSTAVSAPRAMTTYTDANGPALYVATYAGINGIRRWDGTTWSGLGECISGPDVHALAPYDDGMGGGLALYVGGYFSYTLGSLSYWSAARWEGDCTHRIDPFCFGDGTFAPCPCANYGSSQHGCANSASASGALLSHSGTLSPDTLVLQATSELASSVSLFLQAQGMSSNQVTFGDGLNCLSGPVLRLYVKQASGGTAQAPSSGDPSITQRSAALGNPLNPGAVRYYQVAYRVGVLGVCAQPFPSTYNITNGLRVVW